MGKHRYFILVLVLVVLDLASKAVARAYGVHVTHDTTFVIDLLISLGVEIQKTAAAYASFSILFPLFLVTLIWWVYVVPCRYKIEWWNYYTLLIELILAFAVVCSASLDFLVFGAGTNFIPLHVPFLGERIANLADLYAICIFPFGVLCSLSFMFTHLWVEVTRREFVRHYV